MEKLFPDVAYIEKKYNQILIRSFKQDLKLFLFGLFLKRGIGEHLIEDYKSFIPDNNLIDKYNLIRQLSKSSDLIPGTDTPVGEFDKALKNWLSTNKNIINNYKIIFQSKFISFEDFSSFYQENTIPVCFYCKISEKLIDQLINQQKINTKRLLLRGRTLEIDKKDPKGKYEKDNMAFSCYWCNNAKTDEFTDTEFMKIGAEIKSIWEKRLKESF